MDVTDAEQPREPDFVDKALHSLDDLLDRVHDKVLRPIFLAGRAIAFGLIIVLAALVLVIALTIGLVRLLNVYLFAGHEWLTYAVIGVLFIAVGLVIWRRRRPLRLRHQ